MLRASELKRWFDEGMPGSNHFLNDAIADHVLDVWGQLERLILSGKTLWERDGEDAMRAIVRLVDETSLATLRATADARYRIFAERRARQLAAAMKLGPRLVDDSSAA